jgi:hypothetical protein
MARRAGGCAGVNAILNSGLLMLTGCNPFRAFLRRIGKRAAAIEKSSSAVARSGANDCPASKAR